MRNKLRLYILVQLFIQLSPGNDEENLRFQNSRSRDIEDDKLSQIENSNNCSNFVKVLLHI